MFAAAFAPIPIAAAVPAACRNSPMESCGEPFRIVTAICGAFCVTTQPNRHVKMKYANVINVSFPSATINCYKNDEYTQNRQSTITSVLMKNDENIVTSFAAKLFVPSKSINGIKITPTAVTIKYSKIHMMY